MPVRHGNNKGATVKRVLLYVLLCMHAFAIVGCASITHETSHPIRVDTFTPEGKAVMGAECALTNDFTSTTGKSGGGIAVHRSNKDLDISCTAAGQEMATGRAVSRVNAGMAGNIVFGGGIGAIIDHNKGTAYTYPTWIRLVFGQMRTFDRRDEKEGTVVLGTLVGASSVVAGNRASAVAVERSLVQALPAQPRAEWITTGYARIDDVDAIPYLNDGGRQSYRSWLTKDSPRAFAISSSGSLAASVGLKPQDDTLPSDPVVRAVASCNRISKTPCRLYAVNGSVVWVKDAMPAATAGMAAQSSVVP